MPTSSQALLLKNTDGSLKHTFGRPFWQPSQSWMDVYTRNEFVQNSFLSSKDPRRKSSQRVSKTAPTTQHVRYDFQSLPELLKINGIHGSFLYDVNTNSLRVTVPSYQKTSLRNTSNSWRLTHSINNTIRPTTLWSSIRHNRSLNFESDRRRNATEESSDYLFRGTLESNPRTQARGQEMISLQAKEGEAIKITKVPAKDADYFRLFQETPDGVFRLVKTNANAAGSFRLEGTKASEVGDFCLVPEDGYECDDFRLVIVDANNRQFRLLQADPVDGKWFRSLVMSTESDGEFRLVQAEVHAQHSANHRIDSQRHVNKDTTKMAQYKNFDSKHKNLTSATQEMIKFQARDDGTVEIVTTPAQKADYFRLIQESPDGVFRLYKSHQEDKGSFRLARTRPNEIGNFQLVPAYGFESDDFRLVTVNAENGQFRLLKADSFDEKSFRFVAMSNESDGHFRLPQVELRDNVYPTNRNKKSCPAEGESASTTSGMFKLNNTNISANMFRRYKNTPDERTNNSIDNLVFLDNFMPKDASASGGSMPSVLPDISLYDPRHLTSTQRLKTMYHYENGQQMHARYNDPQSLEDVKSARRDISTGESQQHRQSEPGVPKQYRGQRTDEFAIMDKGGIQSYADREKDPSELSWSSSDNDMDAFREKFIDSYREASPETYDKLVSLGFRPTNEAARQITVSKANTTEARLQTDTSVVNGSVKVKPVNVTRFLGSEWKTDRYGAWDNRIDDNNAGEITRCVYTQMRPVARKS